MSRLVEKLTHANTHTHTHLLYRLRVGGTWGEEEDASIVWNGVPQTNGGYGSSNSNASTGSIPSNSWGSSGHRDVRDVREMRDNREMRDHRDNRDHREITNECAADIVGWKQQGSSLSRNAEEPVPRSAGNAQWASNQQVNNSWGESAAAVAAVEPAKKSSSSADNGTALWGGGGVAEQRRPQLPPQPIVSSKPLADSSSFGNWSPARKEGWEDEERANGDSRSAMVDDGTAAWGAPQQRSKPVRLWKEESQQNAKNPCAFAPQGANMGNVQPTASPGLVRGIPPSSLNSGASMSLKANDVWNKSHQQTPQSNRMPLNSWQPDGGMMPREASANWDDGTSSAKSVPGGSAPNTPISANGGKSVMAQCIAQRN